MRSFVERVRPDAYFARKLDEWKAMRRDGWELTVLVETLVDARSRRTASVIALGYYRERRERPLPERGQLALF